MSLRPGEIVMDEFCGGGGVSLGIEDALGQPVDVAINHDEQAIAVHQDNHPRTAHFRQDVWKVGSLEASRGRPVGLYWASPDCRFFSPARGAAPISKGVRVLPFSVVRRLHDLRPRVSIVENVPAIRDWGPLDAEGRRIQARRWGLRRLRPLGGPFRRGLTGTRSGRRTA